MRTGISLSFDLIDCDYVALNGFLSEYLWLFLLGKEKEVPGGKTNQYATPSGINCEGN